MVRTFVALAVAALLAAGAALAQDAKGKGTRAHGTVKKFDAATGTLTVAVKSRGDAEPKEMEFKVTDATKVTVFAVGSNDKTELTGKDGLKGVKEGTPVRVVHADGRATEVTVNPPLPGKKGDK
jgi:Cu/Ag efflux protein CusF